MRVPALSPELADRLRERIADLGPPDPDEGTLPDTLLRFCRDRLNALPLHADAARLWALRPDGVLLGIDREAVAPPVEPESDPQWACTALVRGAARYPELEAVVPWYRAVFLASRGRSYPAAALHPEQRAEAVAAGRVLQVHGGPRAFGSGDVWFTVATPGISDDALCRDGMVCPEPLRPEWMPARDSYDATWDYWRFQDERDLEIPCGRMTGPQRTSYRQAVAGLVARLLRFTPLVVRAGTAPLRELLRRYAAVDTENPEAERALGRRVDDCARRTGNVRLLFDPDRRFESNGDCAPVKSFTSDLPRVLGETLLSEIVAETYSQPQSGRHHIIQPAETWLRDTLRAWLADAAWTIQAGEEMPVPALASPDALPPFLRDFGPWEIPEPPERLHEALVRLDDTGKDTAGTLCRHSLHRLLLPELLEEPPDASPAVTALLQTARQWSVSPDPSVTAQAPALAEDAARLGGDPLYGVPFHLMTLRNPSEVAALVEATVRILARRRYHHWTDDAAESAPSDIADTAAANARENLRRCIQNFLLPRGRR